MATQYPAASQMQARRILRRSRLSPVGAAECGFSGPSSGKGENRGSSGLGGACGANNLDDGHYPNRIAGAHGEIVQLAAKIAFPRLHATGS